MRSTLTWIVLATIAIATSACTPAPADENRARNVALIMIDTLRADRLSCYDFPLETSPEIDRMATMGVRFKRTIAQAPWTRPSIGSILTGIYPRTLGIYKEKDDVLASRFMTLAETLDEAGYRTIGSTANANINTVFNFQQGFDEYIDSNVVWKWMTPQDGELQVPMTRLPTASDRFDAVLKVIDAESPEERLAPHYLQVNVMEVHQAFWGQLRPEYSELFSDREDAPYLRSIRQVSADIDTFVQELVSREGFADTLFIIVSDHGEGLFDHPNIPEARYHGRVLYDSQVAVPMIFYDTSGRFAPGTVVERPVRLLDMMPTVLDYLGIVPTTTMDGISLLPLIDDPNAALELPDRFVVETKLHTFDKIGVYTDSWKLFENHDDMPNSNPTELHQVGVVEDGARTDVGDEHPEIVDELIAYLHAWQAKHPSMPPTLKDGDLSEDELQQLRALGYIK